MNDPYLLLNLDENADDDAVRAAYHRQLRLHPPEQSPERFALISEAYETLRTERDRIYYRLFGPCPPVHEIDAWVRDVDPRTPRLPAEFWLSQSRRAWLCAKLERQDTSQETVGTEPDPPKTRSSNVLNTGGTTSVSSGGGEQAPLEETS